MKPEGTLLLTRSDIAALLDECVIRLFRMEGRYADSL
jgi:hypothetical protein